MLDVVKTVGHKAAVTCCSCSPSSADTFATGGLDSTARLWKLASADERCYYCVRHGTGQLTDMTQVFTVAMTSPNEFLSGGSDGAIQLWDCRTAYRPGGHAASFTAGSAVSGVAFDPQVAPHRCASPLGVGRNI